MAYAMKPSKPGLEEPLENLHRIRITLSSKSIKNLEKVCADLIRGTKDKKLAVKGPVRCQLKPFALPLGRLLVVKEEFDMDVDPIIARPILEKKFPQYYRTMKASLRKKFFRVDGKTIPKRLAIDRCPDDMDKLWWEKFVDLEYSDEKMEQCKKNAENKAKSSITHTLGRKPYHRVHEEMVLENPTQKVSRTMVWKAAHKKKTGEVLPCAVKTYALIEEAEEKRRLECTLSGNDEASLVDLENDPIAEVFGSDKKRSYCRAINSTSTIKQVKVTQAAKAIAEKKAKGRLFSFEIGDRKASGKSS